jgi:HD superfamily phosphohydrolase
MPKKQTIQIRDPLHVFIKVSAEERPVLDCRAFQRLRHIHQLALSYLVYPGATHRRFEHSLGVMELATRIFDVVTDPEHLTDAVRDIVPRDQHQLLTYRRTLRMAALCHDTGHLPFSHAAENELLPEGTDHETITESVIRSDEMTPIWKDLKLDVDDIAALAVEPADAGSLGPWEAILNEIITGEVFGADRMDYLLRDSLHTGVAYGRFDHFRLIDTLRILPPALSGAGEGAQGSDPTLGVELGGSSQPRRSCWLGISCSRRCICIGLGGSTTSTSRIS